MTKPLAGLRLGASGNAVALADVSVADLMANMSDEQRAGLAAELAPKAPEGAAKEPEKGKDAKEKEEAPKEEAADTSQPGYAAGFAAANARAGAVLASEHFAGREKLAATLLANDKMSADEITKALAAAQPGQSGADPEEAARAEMRAELARGQNSNIDPNGGGKAEAPADLMKAAHAKAKERRARSA